MTKFLTLIGFVFLIYSCQGNNEIQSPDKSTKVKLEIIEGSLKLNLVYKNDILLSKVDLKLTEKEESILKNVKILNVTKNSFNNTWETVNGKNKEVVNKYNSFIYHLENEKKQKLDLELRLYDDGMAYRYLFPEGFGQVKENSVLNFNEDLTLWAYNGENHNVGPVKISKFRGKTVRTPVVFKTNAANYFSIQEAAIFDHAPFILNTVQGEAKLNLSQQVDANQKETKTSWRSFILGSRSGALIESNLLVNLNEPCKIEDTSWIRTGRSMWDWRVWGYTAEKDGFEYGLNTISHKRFIDFAAENNIQLLLIDADWYGNEFSKESDPTSARDGVNIEECMAYAKSKGIGVILYLNDIGAKKFGLETVLKQFSDWGAAGIKYGFMRGSIKQKVLNTRKIVELCAKYKLTVNFHDNPIAPSGDRRTWPNLITKEFGHSQADAKRSYFPETIVTAPFVNMIAGPLDLCNGWFALNSAYGNGRHRVFEEIPGTVAAEVAKLIAVYGGIFVMPDAPEEYLKKDDLFDCIRQMPAKFDSFKVLSGEIGEYISVARGSGKEWFIGSLTNREARELEVTFDFLDKNTEYIATLYQDTDETHFMNNKEAYKVKENVKLTKGSILKIKLAPGGGHSMWIRPIK